MPSNRFSKYFVQIVELFLERDLAETTWSAVARSRTHHRVFQAATWAWFMMQNQNLKRGLSVSYRRKKESAYQPEPG